MTTTPFEAMQAAVDIVGSSAHDTNKIAAACFGVDHRGTPFCVRAVNHWPDLIAQNIGTTTRIGNASGTVHAEVACLLAAPMTAGASIAITDPFCPNCAKNMAEAGIKTIYIDHKGFDKDFALRRADDFSDLSLRIVERAGISVFMINRKGGTITPILTPAPDFTPVDDDPVHVLYDVPPDRNVRTLVDLAHGFHPVAPGAAFAAAYLTGENHPPRVVISTARLVIGYRAGAASDQLEMHDMDTGKYSFISEPVNRLLMYARAQGERIDSACLVSSRIPTAREQVNLVAADLTTLFVLDPHAVRDSGAVAAWAQLTRAGILRMLKYDKS